MTDVRLVKDCGLYSNYKRIIDFTGTKSQIIRKQLSWIDSFNPTYISDVNYNKFQNKLVLEIDYEEALTYTYVVLTDITGTSDNPMFFFIQEVANLTNGMDDAEPNVAFYLGLDPIMTYMGEFGFSECMINREHVDRWSNESDKPIYITPNAEGIDAFNKYVTSKKLVNPQYPTLALCVITITSPYLRYAMGTVDGGGGSTPDLDNYTYELKDAVYAASFLVDTSDLDRKLPCKLDASFEWDTGIADYHGYFNGIVHYPSLKEVIDGTFQANLPVDDGSIVAFTLVPCPYVRIGTTVVSGTTCYYLGESAATMDFKWTNFRDPEFDPRNVGSLLLSQDYIEVAFIRPQPSGGTEIDLSGYDIVEFKDLSNVISDVTQITLTDNEWLVPVKPTDGVINNASYEPMLFMQPYVTRKIVKGDGTVIQEIPDINFTEKTFTLRTIVTSGTTSTMFLHGTNFEDIAEGEVAFDNSAVLDVVNDQWKAYLYTRRDTDRQILSNNIWRQSLDNLFYMSYGGALIGSRSATAQPLANPMMKGAYSGVKFYDGSDMGALYPWEHTKGYRGSPSVNLTGAGKRLAGATGLAAAASIATSLIDAHYMWENQLQTEKQIRNEPTRLEMVGDGISTIMTGLKDYRIVVMKVDDVNYERAYQNFRKYGYWINRFEQPNINSRKYYNYLLTNGAIITGAINQGIRDTIAAIFDAGVTIFHYDSGDNDTRHLRYTNKENIESVLSNQEPPSPGSFADTIEKVISNINIEVTFTHE